MHGATPRELSNTYKKIIASLAQHRDSLLVCFRSHGLLCVYVQGIKRLLTGLVNCCFCSVLLEKSLIGRNFIRLS